MLGFPTTNLSVCLSVCLSVRLRLSVWLPVEKKSFALSLARADNSTNCNVLLSSELLFCSQMRTKMTTVIMVMMMTMAVVVVVVVVVGYSSSKQFGLFFFGASLLPFFSLVWRYYYT